MSGNEIIGGNRAALLQDIVGSLWTIEESKADLKRGIGESYTTLRKRGLPAKGLKEIVSDQMKDPEVLKAKRREKAQAGALIGIDTYTAKSGKVSLTDFSAEDRDLFGAKHRVILSDHAEIEDLDEQRDEIKAKAKEAGFDVAMIDQLLKIKKNPTKFYKRSNRLDVYIHAAGLTEEETTKQ